MLPQLPQIGPYFRSDVNRRNYWLGVANGVVHRGVETFTEPYVVLTYFVSLLTSSKFLIGLVAPIRLGGWFLPQLLISEFVQRQERKLPLYRVLMVWRVVSWAVLVATLWFVQDRAALLVAFLVIFTATRLADGAGGLCFMDMVGKVIPPRRRGAFFSTRRLLGGIVALVASGIVGWALAKGPVWGFPREFALLFSLFLAGTAISLFVFTLVDEPAEKVTSHHIGMAAQMRRARRLIADNRTYGRFLLARVLMVIADMAIPFYIIFARESLGAPASLVGVYLIVMLLAGLVVNVWAGRASDRRGNRYLLLVACLLGLASPILALLMGWWHSAPLLFAVVFAINGMYNTCAILAHINFVLDMAPSGDRPIYVGSANTLVGVAVLASSGGGALADWLGIEVLFGIAVVLLLAALVVVTTVREPRLEQGEAALK